MAPRFVAKQLSNPAGFGGKLIRFLMNRGNARLNHLAVSELALSAADRVLEIGFGGGVALNGLLRSARYVCGVDRSADVVAAARRHFSAAVEAGRADFVIGSIEKLPLSGETFDKVLTVNTVYFWHSLEAGVSEIARVLAPGGRVVIGFVPKAKMDRMNMPSDIFMARSPGDLTDALENGNLVDVEIHAPQGADRAMIATAVKRSV